MYVELDKSRFAVSVGGLNLELSSSAVDAGFLGASSLAIVYVVLSSAAAVLLAPPQEVKAALALPTLAFLPFLVGQVFLRAPILSAESTVLDGFGRALVAWLLGTLLLVTFAVVLQLAGAAFLLQRFGLVALALALSGVLAGGVGRRQGRPLSFVVPSAAAVALVVAMVISIAPKAIAAWYTPFPIVSENFLDPLFFAQPALRMLEHGYLDLENLSHAPGLLVLLAVHSQLYDADPMSIHWMASFLLHSVMGAGLFLWARELSGRWTTGLLVAGAGVFILTGTSIFQATPVMVRSNTVLAALVPLCLYVMHRLVTESEAKPSSQIEALVWLQSSAIALFIVMNVDRLGWASNDVRVPLMVGVAAVFAVLLIAFNQARWQWPGLIALFPIVVCFQVFHIYEGAVFLTAIIVYGIALALRNSLVQAPLAIALSLGAIGFFFLQDSGVVSFPRDFSLASSLVFGGTYDEIPIRFGTRAKQIAQVLSWELILALSIGAAGFFVRPRSAFGRAVIIAAAFLFLMYVLPDARAHRTGRAMTPFLAVLFVAGADHAGWLARQVARWLNRDQRLVQEILQFGLAAAVFPAILMPFLDFNTSIRPEQSHHSRVGDIEYVLVDWLHENTDENVRIISDYRTMQILTSLSNKVSLTERKLYPVELSDAGRRQMLRIQNLVLRAPISTIAFSTIRDLRNSEPERERQFLEAAGMSSEDARYYVVWTGRTSLWADSGSLWPTRWPGPPDVPPSDIAIFQDPQFFRQIADFDGQAYVFEVLLPQTTRAGVGVGTSP